jgi:hypothetical protein
MDERDRLRLLAFVEVRLEDDERAAEAATPGPWWYNPGKQWLGPEAFERYELTKGEEFVGHGGPHPFTGAVAATGPANNPQSMADAAFIARHHPNRALAEVNTKRAIVKLYRLAMEHQQDDIAGAYLDAIRLHATAYASHPDFDMRWGR